MVHVYNSALFKVIEGEMPYCHDSKVYALYKTMYGNYSGRFLEILFGLITTPSKHYQCAPFQIKYIHFVALLLSVQMKKHIQDVTVDDIYDFIVVENKFVININFPKMGIKATDDSDIRTHMGKHDNFLLLAWYIPFTGEYYSLFKKVTQNTIRYAIEGVGNLSEADHADILKLRYDLDLNRSNHKCVFSIFDYFDGHEVLQGLSQRFNSFFNTVTDNSDVLEIPLHYKSHIEFVHLYPDVKTSLLHIHSVLYKDADLITLATSYNYRLTYIKDVLHFDKFYFINQKKQKQVVAYHTYLEGSDEETYPQHCKYTDPMVA